MSMRKDLLPSDAVMAEERFIVDVQHRIHLLLEEKRVTRKELAEMLSVSEPRVSQYFQDAGANMTLRTIARIFHSLGEECCVTSPTLEKIFGYAKDIWMRNAKFEGFADRGEKNHDTDTVVGVWHSVNFAWRESHNDNELTKLEKRTPIAA